MLGLTSASAVESRSTVESTAAMKSSSAMESGIAAESAGEPARTRTAPTGPANEAGATAPTAAIEAVEPRTGADKDPARKIARAVVSVRGAGVRSVPIVAIGADRSRTGEDRANSNRNLRMGATCYNHEESYQSYVL